MKINNVFLTLSLLAVFILAVAVTASAQATRTWVSGVGDDVNPCSRTAPCKTFAGAISKTATNGEINCLDPAGYGAITITKSITIDCEDTQGSILGALTNGVIVNITSATDTKKAFKLRGVSINGAGTGINGIRVLSANSVHLNEVVIDGFTQHGISVENSTTALKMVVDQTFIRSNNQHAINCFIVNPGSANLVINDSVLSGNGGNGLNMSSVAKASINDSVIFGNATGVLASSTDLTVTDCEISANTIGITAQLGANVRLTGNSITGNGTGLSGSQIISLGDNVVTGNTVNGVPTSFVVKI